MVDLVANDTQNKAISNNIIDTLKLNPITDNIPRAVIPTIQPVFEVNPKVCNVVRHSNLAVTGSGTIFTTPSDRDFYLNSASLGMIKDATCDVASNSESSLTVTTEGTARRLLQMPLLTLTAQSENATISYPIPLKLDRNTTITIQSATFSAGSLLRYGAITGFTIDPTP